MVFSFYDCLYCSNFTLQLNYHKKVSRMNNKAGSLAKGQFGDRGSLRGTSLGDSLC